MGAVLLTAGADKKTIGIAPLSYHDPPALPRDARSKLGYGNRLKQTLEVKKDLYKTF